MFKNFITLAYRHFVRSPVTSFIQLFGLTLALTVAILVLLWADGELGVNRHNTDQSLIYRFESSMDNVPDRETKRTLTERESLDNIAGIENLTLFQYREDERLSRTDKPRNKDYFNTEVIYADYDFITVFQPTIVKGNALTLNKTNSVVITEGLARKIFANEEPIGKILTDRIGEHYEVTAIMEDPINLHIKFSAIKSLNNLIADYKDRTHGMHSPEHLIYIKLSSNQNVRSIENQISQLCDENRPKPVREKWPNFMAQLRPLSEIYFHGSQVTEQGGYSRHGNLDNLIAYCTIALCALLLACFNLVNLTVSKSLERTKEICIKKVSGASRLSVFLQFYSEMALMCFIALVLALVFGHSLLPRFNDLMQSSVRLTQLFNLRIIGFVGLGVVLVSLLAGGLPALVISKLGPVRAIKGPISNNNGFNVRKLSLFIQFSATIILLTGVLAVYYQISFMRSLPLGFDQEQLVFFDFNVQDYPGKDKVLKESLLQRPEILRISQSRELTPARNPQLDFDGLSFKFRDEILRFQLGSADPAYLDALGLTLLEGKFFEKSFKPEEWKKSEGRQIVINKSAKKALGTDDVIGMRGTFVAPNKKVEIIGVIDDFHINAPNSSIKPLILFSNPDNWNHMLVKIDARNTQSALRLIEQEVEKITDQRPEIKFVEDIYDLQYRDDSNFAELLTTLTLIVMVIGAMGLLGTFMHVIKTRIKEIGVRKVLGASLSQIIKLLAGPVTVTIVWASLIAIPIGAITISSWLDNYPYRIEMDWTIFAIAIGSTLLIAMLTIGWQCWQASNQNPARLIRYE